MDKINKNSPQLNVSDNDFKIKLYPHQKALLHRILHINEKYKDTIYSYGCLTTIPSSGKTFMMLAYIYYTKMLNKISNNLIVVPNNIYSQWCNHIKNIYTSLISVKYLTNNIDINKLYTDQSMLHNYDIIITTPIHYLLLTQVVNSLQFKFDNVIFDEVDTIKSFIDKPIHSKMTWFISATINNCFDYQGNIANIGGYHIPLEILMGNECCCENSFINSSMKIKEPKYEIFVCRDFYIDNVLSKLNLNEKTLQKMNSQNFTDLIELCGNAELNTTQDVVKNLYLNMNKLIEGKNTSLAEVESKLKHCTEYDYQLYMATKAKLEGEKEKYETMTHLIKKYTHKYTICILCFNVIPTIKPINEFKRSIDYYQTSCGDCICSNCNYNLVKNIENHNISEDHKIKINCSYCKTFHTKKSLTLQNTTYSNNEIDNWNKIYMLNEIIKICKNKTIVFSEFRGIDKYLNKICFDNNKQFIELNGGNIFDIDNIIEKFKKEMDILFINDITFGVGLDIEYCSNIILFSKCSNQITNQVVGRCLRPNRKDRLKIYQLKYKNEA
jgi:hypothetical protein